MHSHRQLATVQHAVEGEVLAKVRHPPRRASLVDHAHDDVLDPTHRARVGQVQQTKRDARFAPEAVHTALDRPDHVPELLRLAVQPPLGPVRVHEERVDVSEKPRPLVRGFFSKLVPIRVVLPVQLPVPPHALDPYAGVPGAAPVLQPQTGEGHVRRAQLG